MAIKQGDLISVQIQKLISDAQKYSLRLAAAQKKNVQTIKNGQIMYAQWVSIAKSASAKGDSKKNKQKKLRRLLVKIQNSSKDLDINVPVVVMKKDLVNYRGG